MSSDTRHPGRFLTVAAREKHHLWLRAVYLTGKRVWKVDKGERGTEAAPGFEPGNGGFADLCLTTWLCRRRLQSG